jgi:hypothetical protein
MRMKLKNIYNIFQIKKIIKKLKDEEIKIIIINI